MDIDALTDHEQALLLAAALAGADGSALTQVHGEPGARCRHALEELQALSSSERRHAVAQLGRRLFAPLPAHLDRIHPSWIAPRLEAEPGALRALLEDALPRELVPGREASPLPARVAEPLAPCRGVVCRAALGDLPELPAERRSAAPLATLTDLATWAPADLQELLRRLGLLALRAWLDRAPELTAPLLSRLRPEDARALQAELQRAPVLLNSAPRGHAQDEKHAKEEVLPLIGADLLGSALAPVERRLIALVLPASLGQALLAAAAPDSSAEVLALVRHVDPTTDKELPRS